MPICASVSLSHKAELPQPFAPSTSPCVSSPIKALNTKFLFHLLLTSYSPSYLSAIRSSCSITSYSIASNTKLVQLTAMMVSGALFAAMAASLAMTVQAISNVAVSSSITAGTPTTVTYSDAGSGTYQVYLAATVPGYAEGLSCKLEIPSIFSELNS